MKPIIEVERDDEGGMHTLYLHYSREPIVRTVTKDREGSVNVDLDAKGEPVGLELVSTGDSEVALAIDVAREYGLSLAGVFSSSEIRPAG
jgi:hypothetical protein